MTTKGFPEGWAYEGPDASVGILGEMVWHEDCPADSDDPSEASDTVVRIDRTALRGGGFTVTEIHEFRCPDCGATIHLEDSDYEPCDHAVSAWGRCVACGLTWWEEQNR